ncbi:MAG: hypothetical protein H0V89_02765 [Deltaproteobacteria bacterium]|nr:hypothetical protein [Deltaproteobacteria bacterium]
MASLATSAPAVTRLAVAGALDHADPERTALILADIAAWDPDAVVWTGGFGRAPLPETARALGPALAVPLADDLRRRRGPFEDRFASGERWVVDAGGWRLVGMTGARIEEGVEAGFWLPRVLGVTASYAQAITVVGGPPRSLVPDLPPSNAPRLAAIAREAAGGRLPLVIGGGSGANELFLPDGPWGLAVIVAGNAGAPGHAWPDRPVVGLQTDFARAVAAERALDGDSRTPLAGWWTVTLGEEALAIGFRQLTERGMREVVRGAWTADTGWAFVHVSPGSAVERR